MNILNILILYPFINLLTFFIWLVPGHNIAWGIILLTLTVQLILLIPTRKQAESQRKMAELQPHIDKIKQDYGSDQQAAAMAQMKLFKDNQINPLSNCLLALIQFPILILLYYAIVQGIQPGNPHIYSWVPQSATIATNFFGIDLLAPDKFYILPVIAAVLQFVNMRMTMPKIKPRPDGTIDPSLSLQRNLLYMMPVLTLVFAARFPAAIALYWCVSTIFRIVQQYKVNQKHLSITGLKEEEAKAEKVHDAADKAKKITSGKSTGKVEQKSVQKGVNVTVRKKSS